MKKGHHSFIDRTAHVATTFETLGDITRSGLNIENFDTGGYWIGEGLASTIAATDTTNWQLSR